MAATDAGAGIPRFEFATAGRILFGAGALAEVGPIARGLGGRALLVTGATALHAERVARELRAQGVAHTAFAVPTEPTVALTRAGVEAARTFGCDLVIAIGGGSALDCSKAIAALLANGGDPLDYMEVIGAGKPLSVPSLPMIAIPTTAGTGSEVTRNAVLASPEHGVKASLRSPTMLPRVALVDPELTYSLPPEVTASTGLDALTQLIEPFVSIRANPMTDAFCREGIARAVRSLPHAYRHAWDAAARQDMALASLLGGLALGNAGLGAVHGFASVIGGMYPAPHGSVCAALLPAVSAANLRALAEREPSNPKLARYADLARWLTGEPDAHAEDGIEWLRWIAGDLGIPGLAHHGVTAADVPAVVAKTKVASSTKANPIALTDAELTEALEAAM
jgi:alcohol dehydrogenase class IV